MIEVWRDGELVATAPDSTFDPALRLPTGMYRIVYTDEDWTTTYVMECFLTDGVELQTVTVPRLL